MAKDVAKTTNAEPAPAPELSPVVQEIGRRIMATGRYMPTAVFLMRALNADTIEEATDIGEVVSVSKYLVGERLRIIDVTFLDSDPDLESTIPWFAVFDCYRELSGERIKAECGAEHPLGVLIRACELDWFPFDAEFVPVPISATKTALNLKLAPRRVDTIETPL